MKILITGITGLLGSYLAKRFISLGQIYGLKRKNSNLSLLGEFASKIHWHDGDITDIQSLEEAVKDKDLIIHAAGLVSFDPKDETKLMKINVEGTACLVNALLEMKSKKIIHISSISALGRNPGVTDLDENHKWSDSILNTPYAISKYMGELEIWRGAQEGLQVMAILPTVILGKISDQRSSTRIYDYVLDEKSYYPKGNINYIDVRDASELIFQLYQKDVWGERYILNNQSIPYKYFFEKMASAFGKKAPYKKLNTITLQLALCGSWIGRKIGFSKNILNGQTARLVQLDTNIDNSKVQKLLGYQYIPLEDTFVWATSNENNKAYV